MGATILNDTIYIEKQLNDDMTPGERRVLLAHELGHYRGKHRIKILALMSLLGILSCVLLFKGHFIFFIASMLFFVPIVNTYRRHLEYRADVYALELTNDYDSFVSLMDKLEHDGTTHPGKADRINLAENMRQEYEHS